MISRKGSLNSPAIVVYRRAKCENGEISCFQLEKPLRHSGCRSGNLRTALLSWLEKASNGFDFGRSGMDWMVSSHYYNVVVSDNKALQQVSDSHLGLTGGILLRNQSMG